MWAGFPTPHRPPKKKIKELQIFQNLGVCVCVWTTGLFKIILCPF